MGFALNLMEHGSLRNNMEAESLERYVPNQTKALTYLKYNLDNLNFFSSAVCKYVKFEEGQFYTYLSKNITEEQLHGFKWGGVGQSRSGIEKMVFQVLSKDKDLVSIFDSFEETYEPDSDDLLFDKVGVHYQNEVYYIVSHKECTLEILKKCFKESYIIWHALCVLSRVKFSRHPDQSITEVEIKDFAKNAEQILLGAYDGEGYLCWEKISKTSQQS